MTHPTQDARGYPVALLAAAILSTTAVLIRHLTVSYQMPALVLATWRDLFVALTVLPALALIRPMLLRVRRADLGYLVVYGLVLAVFNAMWTLSVAINGAAAATVLAYSSAAFTALLGWWLLKEPLTWVKVAAVVMSLGGCALVADALSAEAWNTNWVGILTGVLSGLCYAAYSLMGRAASQRGLNAWTTLLYTFIFATVFLLVFNLGGGSFLPGAARTPAELLWLGDRWGGWLVLLALAAGPTVLGFGMYNVSLTLLPSSIANLLVTTEPVFTATIAWFFLGERLDVQQIIGAAVVLGGVIFLRLFEGKRIRTPESAAPADTVSG